MLLDVNTLFFMTMYIEAILGLLLLLSWVQNIGTRAVAWWGFAHLLRSLSIALYGMYGSAPDIVAIDLAGGLLFTSFGVTWAGSRKFAGRAIRPEILVLAAALWMVAVRIPVFTDSAGLRSLFVGALIAGFSWASAYEFWRARNEGLVSCWPAIVLLFGYGVILLMRTPLDAVLHPGPVARELINPWLSLLSAETLFFTIAIAFVLLAVAKERTELRHKTAAMVDSLTGLMNRRAFLEEGEALARRQSAAGRAIAVLLIDLDHFKSVNDRFGHATGDSVLRLFGDICRNHLRSTDLVGRIGGEEFAVLLADANSDNGLSAAERIRTAFAEAAAVVEGCPVKATISIGIAVDRDSDQAFQDLLHLADQALYRAKERGRDRTVMAPREGGLQAGAPSTGIRVRQTVMADT